MSGLPWDDEALREVLAWAANRNEAMADLGTRDPDIARRDARAARALLAALPEVEASWAWAEEYACAMEAYDTESFATHDEQWQGAMESYMAARAARLATEGRDG